MAKVMRFESEGQRLLHVSGVAQAEVAKRLGVGRSAVCEWFSGRKKPGENHRAALASWLAVPIGSWDPGYRRAVAVCPAAADAPPADAPPADAPPADALPASEPSSAPADALPAPAELIRSDEPHTARHDSLRDLRALISETRNRLRALPVESKGAAPLTNTLSRLLAREQEVLAAMAAAESNFARSPEHREFVTRLYRALQPIPGAVEALTTALEGIVAEDGLDHVA